MKKLLSLLLAVMMVAGVLSACGNSAQDEDKKTDIVVFAAASLQESLTEIGEKYMDQHKDISLVFNFDSSGTLKKQIQEGAVCDMFISAGQLQMDQLDKSADPAVNTEGLDFVAKGSRFDILENKVTLAVPEGNKANITSFSDLKKLLPEGKILMAMGNSDVPVGQYTQKILDYYQLDEAALAKANAITYCTNVKEVTSQVSEGAVDCGVIYATDAFSAKLTVVDTATAEMCGQVIYPAAMLSTSQHQTEASAFLQYLQGDEASEIFKGVGFTPMA